MFEDLIIEAQKLLEFSTDKAHDVYHARRVAQESSYLSKQLGYSNLQFMELCGWWHDVGRLARNEGHEEISAIMLRNRLYKLNLQKYAVMAYDAIRFHRWDMNPVTIEGKLLRDADKLDFISPERWDACLKVQQFKHLKDIRDLLPSLRDILHFEESKQLYDKRVKKFLAHNYISKF